MDMWSALSNDKESPRNLMLHNIDEERLIAAVRVGEWKLMKGTTYNGEWDSWYGPDGRTERDYNYTKLHESRVAQSLADLRMPIPEDDTIKALRKQADVTCEKPET